MTINTKIFTMALMVLSLVPSMGFGDVVKLEIPSTKLVSSELIKLFILVTSLGLAPFLMITITSFTRIVIVLSILRTSIGLQQTPPNMVITSLALFLTLFVMAPVFSVAYDEGIKPLIEDKISETKALELTSKPFHKFMIEQTGKKELLTLIDIAKIGKIEDPESTPFRVLIPAFMLSELRKAFEIGFLIFLPFLIIDLLVASTLMSLGMMMLPPASISLPFKLVFFTLIDGWDVLAHNLVKSFS